MFILFEMFEEFLLSQHMLPELHRPEPVEGSFIPSLLKLYRSLSLSKGVGSQKTSQTFQTLQTFQTIFSLQGFMTFPALAIVSVSVNMFEIFPTASLALIS